MAAAATFVLPIPIFVAYLVPLDVDVTGNITAKLWEKFAAVDMEAEKGELKKYGFLSSNFMQLCSNIHRSVWQLLEG
jgi:hypothetical protein